MAEILKPGVYRSGRAWANAWGLFRCTSSRVGRGRRAAVFLVVCFECGGTSFFFVFDGPVYRLLAKNPLHTWRGAFRLPLYIYSSFVSGTICVFFRIIIDYESCTWPISTNPACKDAGELGLTRGTRFVGRLELAAVAVLLSVFCGGFLSVAIFGLVFVFFPCERTWPKACIRQPCLICLSSSNEARPRERSDRDRSLPVGKKASP